MREPAPGHWIPASQPGIPPCCASWLSCQYSKSYLPRPPWAKIYKYLRLIFGDLLCRTCNAGAMWYAYWHKSSVSPVMAWNCGINILLHVARSKRQSGIKVLWCPTLFIWRRDMKPLTWHLILKRTVFFFKVYMSYGKTHNWQKLIIFFLFMKDPFPATVQDQM